MIVKYRMGDQVFHKTYVNSQEDFQKVAEDISIPGKYPRSVRQDVSRQLLEEGKEYIGNDYSFSNTLEKIAGEAVACPDDISNQLQLRAVFFKDSDKKLYNKMNKLSEEVENTSGNFIPRYTMEKVANFVDMVDRVTDMHEYYGNDIKAPEDMYKYTKSDGSRLKKYAVNLQNDTMLTEMEIEGHFPEIRGMLKDAFDMEIDNVKDAVDTLLSLNSNQADIVTKTLF